MSETKNVHDYTTGNCDDVTEAVHGLDIFTKNWCMKCEETAKSNEPMFRCDECEFRRPDDRQCLIKTFAYNHDSQYPLDKFGCMCR